MNEDLSWERFRQIISDEYYAEETNFRKAGSAAGNLWRFLRAMEVGDLVVVPYWNGFYVAEIATPATYADKYIEEDSSYRRGVRWLNDKQPIPRKFAKAALQSLMKFQGTSVDASAAVDDIRACLDFATSGEAPTFTSDFQNSLVHAALAELRSGRLENYGFERLLQTVLMDLGAKEVKVIPRAKDKGADLLATFLVAGAIQQLVAVQAKHWQPDPPVGKDVVLQLVNGIEAEGADLGMVVTSGTISEQATNAAKEYADNGGVHIELIDGEQLARLIVENGIAI